ncbi:Outer membrane protein [Hyella patelloides LEGE 07179]|uniref:Outer membrane protein n=1 Tax=Hyella patelloides LEGE 07179 TaxID=945734 RepID=A0A563VIV3_9CYAN|nr:TolC family protein [Hyella patelloides]VEP11257.1 Outer membrane protein [Hyella patelloides LEGE 07179]
MSKINSIFQIASITTVILSGSLTSAIASNPSEQPPQQTGTNELVFQPNTLLRASLNSDNFAKQVKRNGYSEASAYEIASTNELPVNLLKQSPSSSKILISQNTPETTESETTTPEASELDLLNPDPDQLEIPTTPEEVNIDINQPITLEEAVELALTNNTDLREAQLNLDRSRRELQEARAALYPSLAVQSNFSNSDNASNNRSAEQAGETQTLDSQLGEDTTTFDGDLTLNYNIYTGGRRGADIRRAKRQFEFSELGVETATEQTTFEAKRDYYSLQNADSQVEIEQGAVEDASQTLNDAQLLEEAGLGTRFDVLSAEVELADAQQRLTSARAAQDVARRVLRETLNLGEQVDVQTADDIAKVGIWELALEDSIVNAYDNRVELEQFLLQREINQEQRKIALADIRPQLGIFGTLDFLEVSDDDIDIQSGYTVGAQLQWTLFDGGAAKARARQSDVDVSLTDNGFANQRNQVRLEVEQAFFNLQANEDNINTTEKAVELAEESLRLARLRFQAGVGTQTDVIQAQSSLTTSRGNFLAAIIQYNQSFNELQRAISGVIDDQINTPNGQTNTPNGQN